MNTNERQRTLTNVNKSTFENPPRIPEKIHWVKLAFVCEVAFAEWTLDGGRRQRIVSTESLQESHPLDVPSSGAYAQY